MAEAPVTPPPPGAPVTGTLDLADMQGLVARAYGNLPFARYLLCAIDDPFAARAWLRHIGPEISTAAPGGKSGPALNVAFTWDGVRRLGLGDDAAGTFARPLQEGMVTPHRSRILGDSGANDPTRWRWGGPAHAGAIHVLLLLFARTEDDLDRHHEAVRSRFTASGALREVGEPIEGRLAELGGSEHFGFADGLSQPVLKGWPRRTASVQPPAPAPPGTWSEVNPGEVLLGHRDNFGRPAEGPTVPAGPGPASLLPLAPWAPKRRHLGHNGSFLVFRQLAQDVPAFRRLVEEASAATAVRGAALTPEHVGAKLIGRWASGAALALHPHADPGSAGSNDFGYHGEDPDGFRCPVGAHVRRANPRDASAESPEKTLRSTMNHRILRRGRPYGLPIVDPPTRAGEEAGAERGLLFVCLNSDIERHFEFVQQTWLANGFFAGLDGEVDLIAPQPGGLGTFTIPDRPVRRRITGVPDLVTVKGGGYFFLPGLRAVEYLATMPGPG